MASGSSSAPAPGEWVRINDGRKGPVASVYFNVLDQRVFHVVFAGGQHEVLALEEQIVHCEPDPLPETLPRGTRYKFNGITYEVVDPPYKDGLHWRQGTDVNLETGSPGSCVATLDGIDWESYWLALRLFRADGLSVVEAIDVALADLQALQDMLAE